MKTIRTIFTAVTVVVGGFLLCVAIQSMPTFSSALDGLKDKWPWNTTTTTTIPQWDSGHARVNQYGSTDPVGDYALTGGTHPNTPGTIYQNIMPTIPENQPYETFPPTQGGN